MKVLKRIIACVGLAVCVGLTFSVASDAPENAEPGIIKLKNGEDLVAAYSVFTELIRENGNVDHVLTWRNAALPEYPSDELNAGIVGEVNVRFVVTERGNVEGLSVLNSSTDNFRRSTCAALARWSFMPPMFEGKPCTVTIRAKIFFTRHFKE